MAKVDVRCPFCEQTDPVKKHGHGKSGHQRYRCQTCKRTFQLDYAYRACQPGMKEQIVDGNDSNLLIVFYVQIMPDDFVMQLHRF